MPPQVPQPIDSENGRPLSKLPPLAMACACLTITRHTVISQAEPLDVRVVLRVDAARMAVAHVVVDRAQDVERVIEIARVVDREHGRELFAGKRIGLAGAGLLDHQALGVDELRAREAGDRADLFHRLRGDRGRELAAGEHRFLQRVFFGGVEQHAALLRRAPRACGRRLRRG